MNLKDLYRHLHLFEYLRDNYPCAKPEKLKQDIIDLKREIRKKIHENDDADYRVAFSNSDYSICYLHTLPYDITTIAEAEEYYETYLRRKIWSPWDCSGEWFSAWHKTFQRHGKFYIYHELWCDC